MKALISACAALLLVGCSSQPLPETDHSYRLEWIGLQPLMDNSHITLTFDGQGRAYGNAGCNHWFASYNLKANQLTFDQAGSTRKLCADALMQQEVRFLEMLEKIQRWDFSEQGELRLWPAEGRPLRFWSEN